MKKARLFAAVLILSIAPLLAWQAQAWACQPIQLVSILPRSSGPVGSAITVQGENFNGPVEIRWNSIEGPLLATVQDATVPTTVRVPSVPGGLYLVIMLTRQADRTVSTVGRATFLVEGPTAAGGNLLGAPAGGSTDSGSHLWIIVLAIVAVLGLWGALLIRRRSADSVVLTNAPSEVSEDDGPLEPDANGAPEMASNGSTRRTVRPARSSRPGG